MLDMVIAKCPNCGRCYYGCTEAEVRGKYLEHICSDEVPDNKFWQQIEDILSKANNVNGSYHN